ncbi:MAG: NADH-quinone oxidoreductase subunit NuoN [Gammaproteobacteria bacterium]|nr:NADH-quinone oxidoreductase subunit NuoN [Gammaproteobacteria bacterium]
MEDLLVILPEIVLASMACICLVIDLYVSSKTRYITYLFSQAALVVTAILCVIPQPLKMTAFSEQFIADPFAQVLKVFILILMIFVLLYSRSYIRDRKIAYGEFHVLALFSTLGMMFLVSAKSLLMIYLGLELLTLPLYALVAFQKDSAMAVEASIKYFIMGALASGMLLYGISLLYGLSGSIALNEIAAFVQTAENGTLSVALFALVFIIVGLAFKFGAVPFHMWIPDIYQGAPTNITLLIGTTPKIAAFGMAYRLFHDMMPSFATQWSQIFIVIALLSIALGNIAAVIQTNIKRLLAYSTIAHVGFIFLALLVAPQVGYAPAMYYVVVYALVAACAFGVLLLLSHQGFEAEKLSDLKGLASRSPFLAFLMLLVAFSLTGVPPTVGFYAKFVVLSALVNAGLTWLAAVVVIFSIIGAYYYLKIVRMMYFDAPEVPYPVHGAADMRIALSVNGLAILALGIFPAPLFVICQRVLSGGF